MSHVQKTGPLILGASGQIGRMLYRLWEKGDLDFSGDPVWQYRDPAQAKKQGIIWDLLREGAPEIAPSAVICLAGGRKGPSNAAFGYAAIAVARGAPIIYASSQAVYGPQPGILRENSPCLPEGDYGTDKLAAERAMAAFPNVTCVRIGNVHGADALFRAMCQPPVRLDQFADGQGPRRSIIGPRALGQALIDLAQLDLRDTPVLNLAQPGLIAMADILDAAGAEWMWQDAPETAVPELALDVSRVSALIDIPPATPAQLVAEVAAATTGTLA